MNLSDFAVREPLAVDDSDAFDLGSHRLRFLVTPYVHQWDSMLAYAETKGGRGVQGYLRAMRENDVTGLTEWNPMAEVG